MNGNQADKPNQLLETAPEVSATKYERLLESDRYAEGLRLLDRQLNGAEQPVDAPDEAVPQSALIGSKAPNESQLRNAIAMYQRHQGEVDVDAYGRAA